VINETLFRAVAVVAAIALVAGPRLVALAKAAFSGAEGVSPLTDAHTVLEIARRLQVAGKTKGVELCQQLIDVMLQETP
jgi:hypothetical protein